MTITKYLSEFIGTTEPALCLLLSILAGYPLAIIYRWFIYRTNLIVQHIYFILTGFLLGYWNYNWDILHPICAIFLTFCILKLMKCTKLIVTILFSFNMLYLLIGYYIMGTDNYDINWTMPHCVLVLRLIGITFDLYDGQQPFEQLSNDSRKLSLENCPNLLEFFGYMMFPASFMVGPQFSMKRYQNFLNKNNEQLHLAYETSKKAAMKRFLLGLGYLITYQLLGLIVNDDYLLNEEFNKLNFWKKLIFVGLWGRYTLYKYISCWLLSEGACILFGISFNGLNSVGIPEWNGVENIKLRIFENTTKFSQYIQSFNVNTNQWVGQYIYKRLKFLNNRLISQGVALLFLAVWHGFHSGYYVCFLFEFIVIYVERDIQNLIDSNDKLKGFFNNNKLKYPIEIILRLYTFYFMGWCLMPFALLTFNRYWRVFNYVNYSGIILFIFWPILYGPILKLIFKKSINSNKKEN